MRSINPSLIVIQALSSPPVSNRSSPNESPKRVSTMSIIRMRSNENDLGGLEDLCREVIGEDDIVVEIGCYKGESSTIIEGTSDIHYL